MTANATSATPIVDEPMPKPVRWGEPEISRVTAALHQPSLFYWRGAQTAALLDEFRRHYPLKHCHACSSGSAAIHIAIAALKLQPGDEVIVPPITDMGSVIGILYQQAVPVFADVDPRTYNLDPNAVRPAITARTRAIIAVHLAGNPCDMTALTALGREHNIPVIEDCAQAWGAEHAGRPVGLFGAFACYSFNEYKHLSCGDGGIVGTNVDTWGISLGKWGDKSYDRVGAESDPALLRNPADLAPNYRITELQSAVAAAQLGRLPDIVGRRRQVGGQLNAAVSAAPGLLAPVERTGDRHSYWFYMLRLELPRLRVGRDDYAAALRAEGVPASGGYLPMAVYRYRVFQNHNFFGGSWPVRSLGLTSMDYRDVRCPEAETILAESIVIPINEAMSDAYVGKLCSAISSVARRLAR